MSAAITLRRLAVAGALVAALVAGLLGYVAGARGDTADRTPPQAPNASDTGFARDMSVHHQQAVEMSFIVRDRTDDEEVRRLAYDIINTQANQRGMMLGWLEAWGEPKSSGRPPMEWMDGHRHTAPRDGALMPGMATDAELDGLRAAKDEDAEVRYLRLMTAHHTAGAEMASAAAEQAASEEIRTLAAGMARAQESEITLMADMLGERGAKA
ncbi:DUF305 domain-containing protein [Streptomyces sp. GC420]|uniref:DUF305 domain-containing protein n=1 Tax=Streptomyces sp. GC420 TaxID=2697568 RepID=UPI0014152138|nr:DUF305 domain-containing protein [Streptomyces sp. GC420]NBM16962.1 DUF305 domain-containing protein [Streptomyces sp. GC420]